MLAHHRQAGTPVLLFFGIMEQRYRRHLPHWRNDESTYFVTWRLSRGQEELDSSERDLIANAMKRFDGERYQLTAYVVMDDHVHALVTPIGSNSLQDILHSWKSFTAHQMGRHRKQFGPVWQNEYFDRIVRDDKELGEKLDYILRNPWKRWPE